MEGLLRNKLPPSALPRSCHSDSVGQHLKDLDESERPQPLSQNTHKIKYNKISYFATHNVNSIIQTGKLKILTEICEKEKILIMALQELRNSDQNPIESQGYRLYKGIPGKVVMKKCPQFGCGFLVNLKIIDSIQDFKSQSSRISTLTFKTANKIYTIINAHAPTNIKNYNKKDREESDKCWELLDETLIKIPKSHTKILVGDFNAQLGKERKFRDIVGKWPAQKRTNKNGLRTIEICRNNNLISKSTCFKRLPPKLKTWKHPNYLRGEWQIDHVFMDKHCHREIHNVKVLRGTDSGSDHYIVKIKIKLTPLKKKKHLKINSRKFDPTALINNDEYLKLTRQEINKTQNLKELTTKLKTIAV